MSITAETVAMKLREVEQRSDPRLTAQFSEHPRLAEVIIAIEWWSRQPGGFDAFCERLVSYAGNNLLPAEFWKLANKQGKFSIDDGFKVWRCLPDWARPNNPRCGRLIKFIETGAIDDLATARELGFSRSEIDGFSDWLTAEHCFKKCVEESPRRLRQLLLEQTCVPFSLTEMNDDEWRSAQSVKQWDAQRRRSAEQASIAARIQALRDGRELPVVDKEDSKVAKSEIKLFAIAADLPQLLTDFIDEHARQVRASIPQTETTRMVYEALDYSWDKKRPVSLIAKPGFGKSESEINYCKAHPGRARIVHVPEGNSEADLWAAIAEALGIVVGGRRPHRLKDEIKFVLKYTRLMLCFDEATFLLPQSFNKTTAPRRLNLVRREIIDRGLPCVFSSTEEFERKLESFRKQTGYESEQWTDRMSLPFVLPTKYQLADLKAVLAHHSPHFSPEQISKMAGRAKQLGRNTRFVINVAERAQYLAMANGRQAANFEDVEKACSEIENGAHPRKSESDSAPTFETDRGREIVPAKARLELAPILDPIKL